MHQTNFNSQHDKLKKKGQTNSFQYIYTVFSLSIKPPISNGSPFCSRNPRQTAQRACGVILIKNDLPEAHNTTTTTTKTIR